LTIFTIKQNNNNNNSSNNNNNNNNNNNDNNNNYNDDNNNNNNNNNNNCIMQCQLKSTLKRKGLQLCFKSSQGLAAPHILWKRVP